MEAILQRERLLIGTCLAAMVLLAWVYLLDMARDMSGMSMPTPAAPVSPWNLTDLVLLFVMWAVMMIAMMVPSAIPMTLAFLSVNRQRKGRARPAVSGYVFVFGYIAVWTVYSAVATLAQWGMHEATLVSPGMVLTSPLVTGLLLVVAGIYQWTPLKRRCLVGCRSPLAFLMSRWREGRWGAWMMGLEHGSYCVGCCWMLMALLFVTGVMNLRWVAVIAAFVIAEKLLPRGEVLGKVAGLVLAAIGFVVVAGSL